MYEVFNELGLATHSYPYSVDWGIQSMATPNSKGS